MNKKGFAGIVLSLILAAAVIATVGYFFAKNKLVSTGENNQPQSAQTQNVEIPSGWTKISDNLSIGRFFATVPFANKENANLVRQKLVDLGYSPKDPVLQTAQQILTEQNGTSTEQFMDLTTTSTQGLASYYIEFDPRAVFKNEQSIQAFKSDLEKKLGAGAHPFLIINEEYRVSTSSPNKFWIVDQDKGSDIRPILSFTNRGVNLSTPLDLLTLSSSGAGVISVRLPVKLGQTDSFYFLPNNEVAVFPRATPSKLSIYSAISGNLTDTFDIPATGGNYYVVDVAPAKDNDNIFMSISNVSSNKTDFFAINRKTKEVRTIKTVPDPFLALRTDWSRSGVDKIAIYGSKPVDCYSFYDYGVLNPTDYSIEKYSASQNYIWRGIDMYLSGPNPRTFAPDNNTFSELKKSPKGISFGAGMCDDGVPYGILNVLSLSSGNSVNVESGSDIGIATLGWSGDSRFLLYQVNHYTTSSLPESSEWKVFDAKTGEKTSFSDPAKITDFLSGKDPERNYFMVNFIANRDYRGIRSLDGNVFKISTHEDDVYSVNGTKLDTNNSTGAFDVHLDAGVGRIMSEFNGN